MKHFILIKVQRIIMWIKRNKALYTKDDVIDILDELYMTIQEMENPLNYDFEGYNRCAVDCMNLIHHKIKALER